jgi:hypothetical protein
MDVVVRMSLHTARALPGNLAAVHICFKIKVIKNGLMFFYPTVVFFFICVMKQLLRYRRRSVFALQRYNTKNSKQIFPEKELRRLSAYFHIHVSVSDLYLPTLCLPILLLENMWTDPGNIYM